jgi:hypothetical protein
MSTEIRAGMTAVNAIRGYYTFLTNKTNDPEGQGITSDYELCEKRLQECVKAKGRKLTKKMSVTLNEQGSEKKGWLLDTYRILLLYYCFLDGWSIKVDKNGKIEVRKKYPIE